MNRTFPARLAGWRLSLLGLLCLALLSPLFATTHGTRFSSLVVFGDSLSDTGRLYALTSGGFPMDGAYWQGRESNGPVWVEYLAPELGLADKVLNYAVVGAMSAPTAAIPTGNVWSDTFAGLEGTSLSGQLAQYLAAHSYQVDPDALYIVEGGANDLLHPIAALLANPPATTAEFQAQVTALITPTIVNLSTTVGTLRALGAKNIAVVMVPDFGKAPRLVAYGPQAQMVVSLIVSLVNESLESQLQAMEAVGPKMARIDAMAIIDNVVADPMRHNFHNVTQAFMTIDASTLTVSFADRHPKAASRWFFWDDLHPTTRGHEVFCFDAYQSLDAVFPLLPYRGRH